jgi:hypothetical protein
MTQFLAAGQISFKVFLICFASKFVFAVISEALDYSTVFELLELG